MGKTDSQRHLAAGLARRVSGARRNRGVGRWCAAGALALLLSATTGCMKMFEDMGMTETTHKKDGKTQYGGDATVSVADNSRGRGRSSTHANSKPSGGSTANGSTAKSDTGWFGGGRGKSSKGAASPDYLVDTESNIIRVNKIISSNPWLSFDPDGTKKIDGIRITVYLEAPDKPKGVFGDGTLIVQMYQLDHATDGLETAKLAKEWELPPEKAFPWRATNESLLGKGYSLRLQWGDDAKINGRQAAFIVKYKRSDGKVIASTRQVMKVPAAPSVAVSQ